MEILLMTSYGLNTLPKKIRDAYKKNPENMLLRGRRGAVIEKLREESIPLPKIVTDQKMVMNENIYYCNTTQTYIFYDGTFLKTMKIVDVDTSKLWAIQEYDGYESIAYFNIIDKNLGYMEES